MKRGMRRKRVTEGREREEDEENQPEECVAGWVSVCVYVCVTLPFI